MHSGLFIVEATDNMHNIDYNPSATIAKDSFHGTGISHAASSSCNNKVVLIINQYTSGSVLIASCFQN